MENVLVFIHAALPWITIGLLLAVFFAREAHKEEESETNDNYGAEGMCLGMCAGSAISVLSTLSAGLGMTLGMLIGLAVGTCIKREDRGKDKS